MIENTLNQIEQTIQSSQHLDSDKKEELMALLANLRQEIEHIDDHDAQKAAGVIQQAIEQPSTELTSHGLEHVLLKNLSSHILSSMKP